MGRIDVPLSTLADTLTTLVVVQSSATVNGFIADSAGLNGLDDAYKGKSLQFTTGTLAGMSYPISSYVAAVHYFTTPTPFGATTANPTGVAPEPGDLALIIGPNVR